MKAHSLVTPLLIALALALPSTPAAHAQDAGWLALELAQLLIPREVRLEAGALSGLPGGDHGNAGLALGWRFANHRVGYRLDWEIGTPSSRLSAMMLYKPVIGRRSTLEVGVGPTSWHGNGGMMTHLEARYQVTDTLGVGARLAALPFVDPGADRLRAVEVFTAIRTTSW